ncbi:MAG: hypothetical protein AAF702_42770 [Chloroflexota bacterium]
MPCTKALRYNTSTPTIPTFVVTSLGSNIAETERRSGVTAAPLPEPYDMSTPGFSTDASILDNDSVLETPAGLVVGAIPGFTTNSPHIGRNVVYSELPGSSIYLFSR